MKKRFIKFFQRDANSRSDGISYLLPVTLFTNENDIFLGNFLIKVYYSQPMNLCVPYIAVPDRFGNFEPLEIDGDIFPDIRMDKQTLRETKMRKFRFQLPLAIAAQYLYAVSTYLDLIQEMQLKLMP